VKIEFDPAKDAENIRRHGVSLALVASLDWDSALVWVDAGFEYETCRMIALEPETNSLYCVAFVDNGDMRRIISLRPALRKEVLCYVENS
jgi:uncharacterized protein